MLTGVTAVWLQGCFTVFQLTGLDHIVSPVGSLDSQPYLPARHSSFEWMTRAKGKFMLC